MERSCGSNRCVVVVLVLLVIGTSGILSLHALNSHAAEPMAPQVTWQRLQDPNGCDDTRTYCQPDGRRVEICIDSAAGQMGVLIFEGINIVTGFTLSGKKGEGYVQRQLAKGRWLPCQ